MQLRKMMTEWIVHMFKDQFIRMTHSAFHELLDLVALRRKRYEAARKIAKLWRLNRTWFSLDKQLR